LEEAYIIFLLSRVSSKPIEIEKSEKKVYSIDTGMVNNVSFKTTDDHGHLYENTVAIELFRQRALNAGMEIYYWKNIEHEEVDFLVKQGTKTKSLIQVCYNLDDPDTKKREIRSLLKASKELRCSNLLIITDDYEAEEKHKGKKIKFIPLWKWLLLP
jgi:predicted AAA+ superfamily ATPase